MNGQQTFDFKSPKEQKQSAAMSVSDLNQAIKSKLETGFQTLVINGEISNFTAHSSGHFYFSLKDSESQISAVMFKGSTSSLSFTPKNGLEVLARGKVTVYKPRGSYQILCERMDQVGAGGLKEEFEKLKEKLKAEGLFDSKNKKPIPYLPFKIALVTSPTSAAVQDMLQVLRRRHPAAEITVVPTLTQGDKAAADIIKALTAAEKIPGVEAILLSRGGGSLEDMWCFNDEALARKIFSMTVPVISGVGHEIDFTIADFVADLRAPTPSAAAELVCKNVEEVKEKINQTKRRLLTNIKSRIVHGKSNVTHLSKRLIDPRRKVADMRMRVDELTMRIQRAVKTNLRTSRYRLIQNKKGLHTITKIFDPKKQQLKFLKQNLLRGQQDKLSRLDKRLERSTQVLTALSPFGVLDRGYSIVKDLETGKILRNVNSTGLNKNIEVRLAKGSLVANVTRKINSKIENQKSGDDDVKS
jgi:exodeoxyribonuclease VII large subunit